MGKITGLTIQKNNKDRVNVFIDENFCCGLSCLVVVNNRLKIGDEISKEEIEKLSFDSEINDAFEKAVKYTTIRMRTEKEIRQYLTGKGFLDKVIENTINKLISYKIINDEEFAKAYAQSFSHKYGIKKIRYDLERLGCKAECIDEVIEDIKGKEKESALLCVKKYKRTHKTVVDSKLYSYLISKGFTHETAYNAAFKK